MNETIQFWLDYAGGINIIWLLLSVTAVTQLFKMLLKSFGKLSADSVRPFPYVAGAFLGLLFISFDTIGVMVGVSCGMISSLSYFAALSYLEREGAPVWQQVVAKRLTLK